MCDRYRRAGSRHKAQRKEKLVFTFGQAIMPLMTTYFTYILLIAKSI